MSIPVRIIIVASLAAMLSQAARCHRCHGGDEQDVNLRLDRIARLALPPPLVK